MVYQRRRRCCHRAFAALALSTVLSLPLPAHAMSTTLAEAIDRALSANTGLRITQAGERSADAALKQARGKNSISAEASDTLRTSKARDEDAQTRRISPRVRSVRVLHASRPSARVRI